MNTNPCNTIENCHSEINRLHRRIAQLENQLRSAHNSLTFQVLQRHDREREERREEERRAQQIQPFFPVTPPRRQPPRRR